MRQMPFYYKEPLPHKELKEQVTLCVPQNYFHESEVLKKYILLSKIYPVFYKP